MRSDSLWELRVAEPRARSEKRSKVYRPTGRKSSTKEERLTGKKSDASSKRNQVTAGSKKGVNK